MRPILLYCSLLLLAYSLPAQNRLATVYNTSNGLPSNNVYETLIDKQGFLWAATENGICRFDGTHFTIYTTSNGLSENEVPDIDMDSSGVIWGLPFIKAPVYFNREKGRFENELTDSLLHRIQPGNVGNIFSLQFGGVAVSGNANSLHLIKDGRLTTFQIPVQEYGLIRGVFEISPGRLLVLGSRKIFFHDHGKVQQALQPPVPITTARNNCLLNGTLYMAAGNSIHIFHPASGEFSKKAFPFEISYFGNTGRHFYLVSENGGAYLLDDETLEIIPDGNVYNGVVIKAITEDGNGNIWLSTQDDGLLRIQPKKIGPFDWPAAMAANFNTVARVGEKIFAGNNKGQIVIFTPPHDIATINLAARQPFNVWVRKIIPFTKGIFVATQGGDFWLQRQHNGRYTAAGPVSGWLRASKTAQRINDSLIVSGSHAVAAIWNVYTGVLKDTVHKRVTAIALRNDRIYIGSTDGLYEWRNGKLEKAGDGTGGGLQYRVSAMCATADGLVWAGLSADSLLVWHENTVVAAIPLGKNIPGTTCKALYSSQPGTVWLGTDRGLSCIHYQWRQQQFSYTTAWFGAADGLINENINDITLQNDTVYVATAGGISFLPANLPQTLNEIPVIITNIVAGGRTMGAIAHLPLPYGQGNIRIEYSGIDLSGYTPRFTYRINGGDWQFTSQPFVELQFVPGSYTVEIAAIKRNGEASVKMAKLTVVMKIPFWKAPWFWFGLLLLVLLAVFLAVLRSNRRKRLTQQQRVENDRRVMAAEMSRMAAEKLADEERLTAEKRLAELEMQALRAQINPHFVFNCLNSIKGFIHDHDYEQADRYLDAFSVLLRNTLENSVNGFNTLPQEIEYLDNYLRLEQLRFGNQFTYSINADAIPQPSKILIPSMLLQPYVENAIRHGIRHLQKKQGFVGVTFRTDGLSMVCTIDDNGVGREQAGRMKSARHIEYQGRGMQISQRRAQLYQATVTVTDKQQSDGTAAGTTVTLIAPLTKKDDDGKNYDYSGGR